MDMDKDTDTGMNTDMDAEKDTDMDTPMIKCKAVTILYATNYFFSY
jgi:hypothetical protein